MHDVLTVTFDDISSRLELHGQTETFTAITCGRMLNGERYIPLVQMYR